MRYLKTPALQSFCRLLASSFLIAEALARELIGAFVRNRYSSPQSCMALISGLSDSPALEREYSTFGGTTGYTLRTITPSCSSSRNCAVRMRGLTVGFNR